MTIKQISIFLENTYGKLGKILAILGEGNIRIIAATVADTSEFGILRIIVCDVGKAYGLLRENSVNVSLTDVLAIILDSNAGTFASALNLFTVAGLSIEYMYCFPAGGGKSVLVLRTDNHDAAFEVIRGNNLECIGENELNTMLKL
jgi:hypothetical protein